MILKKMLKYILAIGFLCSSQMVAQGTDDVFMESGVGARAQALGNAFVANASDGSAVYWNPAGLDYLLQPNLVVNHSTLIGGGYYNFAAASYPFIQFGSVGVGVMRYAIDGIQGTTNDLPGKVLSYSEAVYMLSYGRKLPWWGLSAGFTSKIRVVNSYREDNFQPVSGSSGGLDIGIMYRSQSDNVFLRDLSLGLNVQNVVQPTIKLDVASYKDPLNIKFGMSKDFYFGDDQVRRFTVVADVNKSSRTPSPTYSFGAEFAFNRFLISRAGIDNGRMSLGMGTEFTQFQKFQVDYSVNLSNQYGQALHRVSLTMNFGKTIEERVQIARVRRTEEDKTLVQRNQEAAKARALKEHQALGKELFKSQKLLPALVEFEQVLQLDPENEAAKTYVDSVRLLMDAKLAEQLADTAAAMQEMTISQENNKFVQDHYRKASALVQRGDYLAAISEYESALDRSPDNSEITKAIAETRGLLDRKIGSFIAKARSSAAANNFAEALKLLSEARSLDPANETIQREIDSELKRISNRLSFLESTRTGLDAYQQGDYQAAMEAFEEALLIDPTNPTVKEYHKKSIVRSFATFKNLEGDQEKTYLQGVDLYVEGKYEQAIIIWQRILEKDPLNKRVLKAIDKAEEQLKQLKQKK